MAGRGLFDAPDLEGTANKLAEHLPQGLAWEAKNIDGTNLRGLLLSTAAPFNNVEGRIEELACQFDINQTTLLIREWEVSVGLPDECSDPNATLEERRSAVIERLSRNPIVTLQEMQDYVDLLFPEDNIELRLGSDFLSFEYDFEYTFTGGINDRFTIIAKVPRQEPCFEYDFEYCFTGAADFDRLRCVLEQVIPANVVLIIVECDI